MVGGRSVRSPRHSLRTAYAHDNDGERWRLTLVRDGETVAAFTTARTAVIAAAGYLLEQSDDPDALAAQWELETDWLLGLSSPECWSLDGTLGDRLVAGAAVLAPKQPSS